MGPVDARDGGGEGGGGGGAWPPAGWVLRDEACRVLGVSVETYKRWFNLGLIRCGRAVRKPGGGWCKIYPLDELVRLKERMAEVRGRLPEGFVRADEAAAMFGISRSNWKKWQRAGRVPPGRRVKLPGLRSWVSAYARADLERLLAGFERLGQPHPDPERAGVWRVPVMSFSTTRCEALVDADDVPRVAGRRWNWMDRGDGFTPAVAEACPTGGTLLKHAVLGLETARWCVDHANGDPLDCRRANLVARDYNAKSHRASKQVVHAGQPCTSRFKGVSREPSRGSWRVTVQKGGVPRFVGRFRDELAAAQAYDEAARELFGGHARLNFPDGVDARLERETATAPDAAADAAGVAVDANGEPTAPARWRRTELDLAA